MSACDSKRTSVHAAAIQLALHRATGYFVEMPSARPVQFELLEPARTTILDWLERRCGALDDFVFPSRTEPCRHISTRQYARLVDEWVSAIRLTPRGLWHPFSPPNETAIIYKQTGNLSAVQILLGHTKIETTGHYLGVEVEDALSPAEGTEV